MDSLKDEIYTIAIIGRPNVGKSTLFNRLMGQRLALVDKTPGLTRDRREGITHLFGIPIRLVDTAGFEGSRQLDDEHLKARSLNKAMVRDMLRQTRNALIYADLALFLLDTREGITNDDVALYKWLTEAADSAEKDTDRKIVEEVKEQTPPVEEKAEKVVDKYRAEELAYYEMEKNQVEREPLVIGKLPGE